MMHDMTEMTFKYIQYLCEMPSKVLDSQYHRESCKVWCSYWPSSSLHGDDSAWCSFRWNPGNPRWCRANWTLHTSHCWTCMWAKYAMQIWLESRHICWLFFYMWHRVMTCLESNKQHIMVWHVSCVFSPGKTWCSPIHSVQFRKIDRHGSWSGSARRPRILTAPGTQVRINMVISMHPMSMCRSTSHFKLISTNVLWGRLTRMPSGSKDIANGQKKTRPIYWWQ